MKFQKLQNIFALTIIIVKHFHVRIFRTHLCPQLSFNLVKVDLIINIAFYENWTFCLTGRSIFSNSFSLYRLFSSTLDFHRTFLISFFFVSGQSSFGIHQERKVTWVFDWRKIKRKWFSSFSDLLKSGAGF